MKGIRLAHGAVFVTDGSFTVRLLEGKECDISPVSYQVLEWELSSEDPSRWEYLSEGDILGLPDDGYRKILAVFDRVRRILS